MRAILTWHSVDDSGSVISVSPSRFAEQVRWLASGNVAVVSVPELLALPSSSAAVAVTFDDGFVNFATVAWPRLRDEGLPVTLFVPTRYVGKTNRWAATPGGAMPELPLLDWDALGRLAEEGVTLGAHTRTHADLRALDSRRLSEEIPGSFDDIERATGKRPEGFAYPYGYLNARVVAAARATGAWAVTTALRPLDVTDDAYELPRLDSYFLRGPARIGSFGSPLFQFYVGMRAIVRRVRGR